jgi:hypothetical protein
MFKIAEIFFFFLRQFPCAERPMLLMILPTGSDFAATSPTVRYLCCWLSNPSSPFALSPILDASFDTSHKQTLQANNWLL